MAHQNTINQIANRLAIALAHHLRENETLDIAQTHYLEEEVVDTLYEQLAEVGFIPKNSCDEPLFGTRVDEEQQEIYEMNAQITQLKSRLKGYEGAWRGIEEDLFEIRVLRKENEVLKQRIAELEHREGLGGGD